MKLTIHRGSREIGGSCIEVAHCNTRIILDIGMPLVDADGASLEFGKFRNKPLPELQTMGILPQVKGLYKNSSDKSIGAVLISHAHLDHYGLLEHIDESIPVYAGEGTKRIFHINSIFLGQKDLVNPIKPIVSGKSFEVGSLKVTPYLMDHSAFDSYAFVIQGGGKSVIYTGDFREHGRKAKAFEYFLKLAPKRADALLLEGSVLGREDKETLTEADIQKKTTDILKRTDNIVFVYPSSQNVDRLVTFYKAASEAKRLFVIDVYTANVLDILKDTPGVNKLPHPSAQYGNIRVYFPRGVCKTLEAAGRENLLAKFRDYVIRYKEMSENRNKILMTVRPSAMSYMSKINGIEGAPVLYSMWEGYKEDDTFKKFKSFLEQRDMPLMSLHTSGHASIETLKRVSETLLPKKLIPIHTFHPDKYVGLFENVEFHNDGESWEV